MKSPNKISYFIGLTVCSYIIGKVLYGSYNNDNILAIFLYFGVGLVWLFCFYKIIKTEQKTTLTKFKVTKHWMSIVSLLTLIPIICIYIYYQRKLNVPTLIKAERHGVYADFKTDGSYIIKSGAWASKKHFYGKYILDDNIIQIDTSNLDDVLTSNRFLIKHTNFEDEKLKPNSDRLYTKEFLVQIDKIGNVIKARQIENDTLPYRFEIVVDNTK